MTRIIKTHSGTYSVQEKVFFFFWVDKQAKNTNGDEIPATLTGFENLQAAYRNAQTVDVYFHENCFDRYFLDNVGKEISKLKEELEELDWKFAEYLCHTTRNRISKTYGTAEEMIAVFNQAQSDLIEEIIRENAK